MIWLQIVLYKNKRKNSNDLIINASIHHKNYRYHRFGHFLSYYEIRYIIEIQNKSKTNPKKIQNK